MALDSIGALVAPKPLRLGHAQAGERLGMALDSLRLGHAQAGERLGMALDSIGALASRKGRNIPEGRAKTEGPA